MLFKLLRAVDEECNRPLAVALRAPQLRAARHGIHDSATGALATERLQTHGRLFGKHHPLNLSSEAVVQIQILLVYGTCNDKLMTANKPVEGVDALQVSGHLQGVMTMGFGGRQHILQMPQDCGLVTWLFH